MRNYDQYTNIIVNCHTPTKEKVEEVKNEFHDELECVYETLPKHSLLYTKNFL